MNARIAWVIGLFAALLVLLTLGLRLNPREVPSPLIGKPAPAFELPRLDAPGRTFSQKEMLGQVWVMNVWASWCVACRDEHALLVEFAKSGVAPLYGLNYKDQRDDGLKWLARYGNPFFATVYDSAGRIAIDYGVYGVPETYVIDRKGVIRYKQIGAVTREVLAQKILPLVGQLARE